MRNEISGKFDALVKSLDQSGLDALRRSLATEIAMRSGTGEMDTSIHLDAIRPGMSASDKEQAVQEIARVLREQR
jgi:hypothetical protein